MIFLHLQGKQRGVCKDTAGHKSQTAGGWAQVASIFSTLLNEHVRLRVTLMAEEPTPMLSYRLAGVPTLTAHAS